MKKKNGMRYQMDKTRPLSWSAISSFEYDKEQWFAKYVLGEKQEPNEAMLFGKTIGERLASDPKFMPEVPRLPLYEHKLSAKLGEIPLIGYIDAFDLENKAMLEYKTGKTWSKEKVAGHGQLDMYAAMIYTQHKIHPKDLDIKLVWLKTESSGDFKTYFSKGMKPVIFPVKKDMIDILRMLQRVKTTWQEMQLFVKEKNKGL